jgi:hypothetical protein
MLPEQLQLSQSSLCNNGRHAQLDTSDLTLADDPGCGGGDAGGRVARPPFAGQTAQAAIGPYALDRGLAQLP